MAHRNIHYEAAFEDYLRCMGLPYVAVDEAKKAIFAGAAIKSFDFLVYSTNGPNLLADVKGRKFPDTGGGPRRGNTRAWENWITRDDVIGLGEWEKVFGPDFRATLIFAYWLQGRPPTQRQVADHRHALGRLRPAGRRHRLVPLARARATDCSLPIAGLRMISTAGHCMTAWGSYNLLS